MESIHHEEYTIRRATDGDIQGFLELHDTVFGSWPESKAREVFDWKYRENPYFEELPVIVAETDGEIVGAKGHFGLEIVVGEESLLGVQAGDLMVHSDHRGKGIQVEMIRLDEVLYEEDSRLRFGVPSKTAFDNALDAGHRAVANPLYVRWLSRPKSDSGTPRRRAGRLIALASYSGYRMVADAFSRAEPGLIVERADELPIAVLESLYATHVPAGIHTRRDADFYRWRFDDPLHEYETYLARRNGRVEAAAVVSDDGTTICIREILPCDADSGIVRALLGAVSSGFKDRAAILAWRPNDVAGSAFYKSGFVRPNLVPTVWYPSDIVVRAVDGDWTVSGLRVDEPEHWDLQLIARDY